MITKNLNFIIFIFIALFYTSCGEENSLKGVTKPELSTPANNSFIFDNLSLDLKWENSNSVGLTGPIIYTIYLDEKTNPTTAIGTSRIPIYNAKNLKYNTVYYWKVEAKIEGIKESSNEIYSFTIKNTLDTEKNALVAIFNSLGGENWNENTNWNSTENIKDWYGVKVDYRGFVTELKLPNNNLTNSIPNDILNLTHLRVLDLSGNNFNTTIPKNIGGLTKLDSLSLSNSKFIGNIPLELSNLAALKYLYLDDNKLSGAIPNDFGNLKNLLLLSANQNDLSGNLPKTLGNLRKLQKISFSNNFLNGSIPIEIANIPALNTFILENNELTGILPDFSSTNMNTFLVNKNTGLTGLLQTSGLCFPPLINKNISNTGIIDCP